MTKRSNGFTVIELVFIVVILIIAGIFFFIQQHNLVVVGKDNTRKTAINAMYYDLEEVYYPANHSYPRTISMDNLKAVDPALFTDPNGVKLGDKGSNYSYTSTGCNDNQCTGYTLKADLTNEADYTKTQRH